MAGAGRCYISGRYNLVLLRKRKPKPIKNETQEPEQPAVVVTPIAVTEPVNEEPVPLVYTSAIYLFGNFEV